MVRFQAGSALGDASAAYGSVHKCLQNTCQVTRISRMLIDLNLCSPPSKLDSSFDRVSTRFAEFKLRLGISVGEGGRGEAL